MMHFLGADQDQVPRLPAVPGTIQINLKFSAQSKEHLDIGMVVGKGRRFPHLPPSVSDTKKGQGIPSMYVFSSLI